MDVLDHALESSHERSNDSGGPDLADSKQFVHVQINDDDDTVASIAGVNSEGQLSIDPSVQYQFRAETSQGQVTYRVVQVDQGEGQSPAQVITAAPFSGTQLSQAAVIQNNYSTNADSPTPPQQEILTTTANGETVRRFYVPLAAEGSNSVESLDATQVQGATLQAHGGQFYVMMSPQDVLQNQRQIAPRTTLSPRGDGSRTNRDDRRRATHNEVERRRRDKINNWIVKLSKLLPESFQENTKQGQASKGGILNKACDYITELRSANSRMAECLNETERLSVDNELLRHQLEEMKQENALLRSTLQTHGLVPPELPNSASS